jgi:hypothetical protein
VVNVQQLLLENRFNGRDVFKGDVGIVKLTIGQLLVYKRVNHSLMFSTVTFFMLLEAASTASAIIRMAVSLLGGIGPGR